MDNGIEANDLAISANTQQINVLKGSSYTTVDLDYKNGWTRVVGSSISLNKKDNIVFISGMINGTSGVLTGGTVILDLSKFPPSENARILLFTTTSANNVVGLVSLPDKCIKLQSTATAVSYFVNGFYFTN